MQSAQESKQELEAAIRYAENAISSAKQTIETMEFRQEMAKKQSSEQTGREEALENQLNAANANVQFHVDREAGFLDQIKALEKEVQRQQDLGQGYYDSMMTFKEKADGLSATIQRLKDEHTQRVAELYKQVEFYKEAYTELEVANGKGVPTMPVIPKDVAIAIFREGIQTGVDAACSELDGQTINICENEYCGDFEVTFARDIHLEDELDLDWMRGKCGDYTEDAVIDALKGLCADKEFECRIHGVDDQENNSESA